jgi:hypothetical protein
LKTIASVTGRRGAPFDAPGAFRNPAKLSLNVALTNIMSDCFWGQQTKFTWKWGSNICNYGGVSYVDPSYYVLPVGNVYNPTDKVQQVLQYPYEPELGPTTSTATRRWNRFRRISPST